MSPIPDFDDTEIWIVQSAINERYGKAVELQQADTETSIRPGAHEPTWCPALFWSEQGVSMVIVKTGERQYRGMFYYQPNEQFGVGHDAFHDLGECVSTLLKLQADHEKDMSGVTSGKTSKDLN